MIEGILIGVGIVVGAIVLIAVGFVLGVYGLLFGTMDWLTNIDGPPRVGLIEDWKRRRAYKRGK